MTASLIQMSSTDTLPDRPYPFGGRNRSPGGYLPVMWNHSRDGRQLWYWRVNAVVYVDTSIHGPCRWRVHDPPTEGVGRDVWDAMAQADAVDRPRTTDPGDATT